MENQNNDTATLPSSDQLFATEEQSIVGNLAPVIELAPDELAEQQRARVPDEDGNLAPVKNDATGYQKMQSERDSALANANRMQAQLDEYQQWTPALRMLQENPQLLDQMANGPQPKQTVNVNNTQEAKVARPERPSKPKGFSRFEAGSEPDSESAKYLDAMDDYNLNMEDYRESLEIKRNQEYQEQQQASQVESMQRKYLSEVQTTLMKDHNFTTERTQQFINKMSNPNPSLNELVQLFEIQEKLQGQPQLTKEQISQKAGQLKQQQQRQDNFKLPATGGFTAPKTDANADFVSSIGRSRISSEQLFAKKITR